MLKTATFIHSRTVVVVPVYQRHLNAFEKVSLAQTKKVFEDRDIVFIAPESLRVDYGELSAGIRIERFSDNFFTGTASYSSLMLSAEFYERFSEYEYMLLCQLDAFVFHDCLKDFCSLGYDYIGAPVRRYAAYWKDIRAIVGNGGFSLRKIASVLRVLQRKDEVFARRPVIWPENYFLRWEDLFFSFCGVLPDMDFQVPDFMTALAFAVVENTGHAYDRMPGWMPFGCHGWSSFDGQFWKPIIEAFGYDLPPMEGRSTEKVRHDVLKNYLARRIRRASHPCQEKVLAAVKKFLPQDAREIVIWGWGTYGEQMLRLFQQAGRDVSLIFDRKAVQGSSVASAELMPPDFCLIRERRLFVLVATKKHEDEICKDLDAHGFVEGKAYGRVSALLETMIRAYLRAISCSMRGGVIC